MKNTMRQLTISAILISLGVIIPLLVHTFGGGGLGKILLPMHIPVLLAAFYLRPLFAVFVGAVTPLISTALTGMPVLFPMMYVMVLELFTYTLCISLLFRYFSKSKKLKENKLHIYFPLIIAMIAGRIISSTAIWILTNHEVLNIKSAIPEISGIFILVITTGIIGIIIQIIIIPLLVINTESVLN